MVQKRFQKTTHFVFPFFYFPVLFVPCFFYMFFLFFLFGFAPVAYPACGFQLRKCFLRSKICFVSFFLKQKNTEIKFSFFKDITHVLQGSFWCDVLWKKWHSGSQSFAWSVVLRFHVNFCAHPCRLQPMVLWPVRPSVIEGSTQ